MLCKVNMIQEMWFSTEATVYSSHGGITCTVLPCFAGCVGSFYIHRSTFGSMTCVTAKNMAQHPTNWHTGISLKLSELYVSIISSVKLHYKNVSVALHNAIVILPSLIEIVQICHSLLIDSSILFNEESFLYYYQVNNLYSLCPI